MAFGITGFAALRLEPRPQVFQALSLGSQAPVPPLPPYGTPNQNLVPVAQTGNPAVPIHLSVAAQGAFKAILRIRAAPNTTSAVGAHNPTVHPQAQNARSGSRQGPVSFSLTQAPAYQTSGQNALEQSQYVLPSSHGAVARIVATVNQLAISAVYPAPIFSFSA